MRSSSSAGTVMSMACSSAVVAYTMKRWNWPPMASAMSPNTANNAGLTLRFKSGF